jgi:hypothetical protein
VSTVDHAFPATPAVGSAVELRAEGGQTFTARIVETLVASFVLSGLGAGLPLGAALVLRWFTPDTGAWEVDVEPVGAGRTDGNLEVRPLGEHRAAGGRRALRLPAGRASMAAEAVSGIYATGRPVELIMLDASANGLACIGWGRPPAANDIFRLELGIVRPAKWFEGRIARLQSQPFGRWLAGFEFLPRSPEELEWLLDWRDAWVELVQDG